jgi:hypothetical protein
MIDKEQVIIDLDKSTNELIAQMEKCEENDFNFSPEISCWSTAQIAEHILLLETSVNRVMQKAVKTERQIDLKLWPMKKGFEDPLKKYQAPDFIHPSINPKPKTDLINGIITQRELLKQYIRTSDLTETLIYKHPVIGDMTRLEWIYFIIHHGARHMRQIEKMRKG